LYPSGVFRLAATPRTYVDYSNDEIDVVSEDTCFLEIDFLPTADIVLTTNDEIIMTREQAAYYLSIQASDGDFQIVPGSNCPTGIQGFNQTQIGT
jgi:hypothetical protein